MRQTGYTTGVFDLFHIGHLNLIKKAKSECDFLIVGVTTDEVCRIIKNKEPVIPYKERVEIIKSIRYVDQVVPQDKIDEMADWKKYKFNTIFKGSDWENSDKWNVLKEKFNKIGVQVKFFEYTNTTSSTLIRHILNSQILND